MILLDGPNQPWYAEVKGNGRIVLNPAVPTARELLAKHYPNLVATLDNQTDADETIDEVVRLMKKKGALAGEEADVFTKLERTQKDRKDKKEGRK
jgi:hypothetical protein